jgi:HEAT repeat protein
MVEERQDKAAGTGVSWPVESIIDALNSGKPEARHEAEEALKKIGEPAIEGLVNRLRGGGQIEYKVRIAILRILSEIGWQPSDNHERALYYIARQQWPELTALGKDAVEPLLEILRDENHHIRKEAVIVLGNIADARATEPLLESLKDSHPEVRREAAAALGHIKDVIAIEPLLAALEDSDPQVQDAAFQGLSMIKTAQASRVLFNALKVVDRHTAEKILELLELRQWQPASDSEKALFLVARHQWDELPALGKDAVDPLLNILNTEDHLVRKEAIRVLGEIGDSRAVKPLILELNDDMDVIREAAKSALLKIGAPHLAGPLMAALDHKMARTRELAAEILDISGWKPLNNQELALYLVARGHWHILDAIGADAVEPLLHALEDSLPKVREEAAAVLGKIGDQRAVEPLIDALNDDTLAVAESAKTALNRIQTPEAVEPLLNALAGGGDITRAAASECLGLIGDVRGLQPLLKLRKSYTSSYLITPTGTSARVMDNINLAIHKIESKLDGPNYEGKVCAKCSCYYDKFRLKKGFLQYYYYSACSQCFSNSYTIIGVNLIVLTMDHSLSTAWKKEEDVLTVNWFLRKAPFDYEEIRIVDADDREVEEMVMKLTNDVNKKRRKRMSEAPLYLSAGLTLPRARVNLLRDHFKVFIEEKEQ